MVMEALLSWAEPRSPWTCRCRGDLSDAQPPPGRSNSKFELRADLFSHHVCPRGLAFVATGDQISRGDPQQEVGQQERRVNQNDRCIDRC